MAAKTIFLKLRNNANFYANSRGNDGADLIFFFFFFFASKEVYPIVRQLDKITVKKAQAKVVKCTKNKMFGP